MATLTLPSSTPLAEINTTPLIDVLLVLLIMMIMSVPIAANVVPVDLPRPGPGTPVAPIRPENLLTVTPQGAMLWNGSTIDEPRLAATLHALTALRPEPLVKLQPDAGAPYGVSARVIRMVKYSGLTSFAFVGNERYAEFGKAAR
ncbi:MAG: ExbD/TolR family protein [Novosphingobium sp.]